MKACVMVLLCWCVCGLSQVFAETALGLPVENVQTVKLSNDVGKNQIQFVSSAPMEEIHGTAADISGQFQIDPQNLEGLSGHIEVGVKSMETGIAKRDEHMHSKDWLDAEKFPKIIFDVTGLQEVSVKPDKDKALVKATALGNFTLHGVTKALTIPVEITYLLANEKTKKRASGDLVLVKGKFQIALKDFNIQGARGMVGSRVGTDIDLEANFFGSTVSGEAGK